MNPHKDQGKEQSTMQTQDITRRAFHGLLAAAGVSAFLPRLGAAKALSAFVHPGILHTSADLERMRRGVLNNLAPIAQGFAKLREHPLSQIDKADRPFSSEIGRNPSVNSAAFDQDANAAYQCALIAAVTGDESYAKVAYGIVAGWSDSLHIVSGADAVLMAGLGPFKFVNAAEILRATGYLNPVQVEACRQMLRRAILPALIDFAPFANGNWDTAAIKTMMAIAVFCDDQVLFERAVLYYLYGDGDGRLDHYIYESGQCQESGRDQQHTQLGLAHMTDACEIAWHQGIDLYGALDNRLLKGFEYTAAYNLGDAVVFCPDLDRTGKYRHLVISPRGALRPIYEQVLAHYHGRQGLPAPAVERAVQMLRPEGAGPGADQTGFGTLLYAGARSEQSGVLALAPPVALRAEASKASIELRWPAVKEAHSYSVERARHDGRFRKLQTKTTERQFRDSSVEVGKQYCYRVTAHRYTLSSAPSRIARIFTGLPAPWKEMRIGNPSVPGSVNYDGSVLTLRSAGLGVLQPADEAYCIYAASPHDRLQARFLPQVASQSAVFGMMHREDASPKASCIALLLSPDAGDIERHGWRLRMLARSEERILQTIATYPLSDPIVQYGRLMRPVWFRLEIRKLNIQASFSRDGNTWILVGEAPIARHGLFALVSSSGLAEVDTEVRFDSILLTSAD